jgi:hypothetical protein
MRARLPTHVSMFSASFRAGTTMLTEGASPGTGRRAGSPRGGLVRKSRKPRMANQGRLRIRGVSTAHRYGSIVRLNVCGSGVHDER